MMIRVYQPVPSLVSRVNVPMNIKIGDTTLGNDQCVYIWTDGIYSGLRSEKEKLFALVIIRVNGHGQKQFLAIEDGMRESTQSWREVLLKLKYRGRNIPQMVFGDRALGFWAAIVGI